MDSTCGLADKFGNLVLHLIWEQLLYLVCYGQNIKQLNKQLEELTLERISIQHRIDEATNNIERIEEKVLRWLSKVDEISEQVEQLLKEGQPKRECSLTSCPNPWLRYNLSKRAKAMAQQVADIFGNAKFDTVSYRLPPQSPPQSMLELTNKESNEGINSRVPIMNQIMEALRNSSVNMIGLCGLGGVGKTTMAKEIAKNQKMFEKAVMATVSNELNIENIQGQIADELGMQLNGKTEAVRASRLRERLKHEKNMLLIFDDLWVELDLRKVGIPFLDVENNSKKNEGCKILLTSRNKILLSDVMKCQKIIEMSILLDDEAWELFMRIAELSIDSSNPELISIATKIVQKCGGLPLLIATLAKALRNKDMNEWKNALARLNHPLRRNITGIKEADLILKWSYDHLSSSENKNIFLLASMLSHDPSIEDLIMYSMGLDFLEHTENIEDAHIGLFAIVSKLKSLNLFLDSSSSHHITMHDVIRDVALSIAFNELHAFIVRYRTLNEWPDEYKLEDFKGICLQESDINVDLPEELYGPKLKFFMLNSTKLDLTIPKMFFKSSKELKVLAFTKVHFSSLPSLSYMKKLKTVCLHSCLLEDITEIRTLKNLKVLSLAYSEIQRLPVELAELTSLQMLNLSHCSNLKVIPHKLLSSLKKLEVLYMENSFNQWKVEGTGEAYENASLDELKDLPISSLDIHIPNVSMLPENLFLDMKLKRYRILIGKCWQWWQCNHETSKILRLELKREIHLKRWVQKLLKGVEDLYLYGSNGLDNVLYSHEESRFPHLRHLRIQNNDDIKFIVLNSAHRKAAFPILESLILQDLKALEKLCEGTNTVAFHQLHTLKMRNLPSLTADLCLNDGATNNVSNKLVRSLFNKVLLPKLKILELCNLNIEQLSINSLSNLKTLIVKECSFVKLLPFHVLKSLNNLEELEIEQCRMLKMVFDFEDFNDYKEIESSSVVVPLKRLKLQRLPKLKNVWSNHYQGNISFPSLRRVHVAYCERLTSIFPASIAKGMLHNLEELRICKCGIDVIVANDQASESAIAAFRFPTLTSLELYGLPELKSFYPQRHKLEWLNLERLSIEYCDALEIFEKEVSSSLDIHEEESTLKSNYPLLSRDQVVHNLEELKLQGKQAKMIGCSLFPTCNFPNLKMLYLYVFEAATISYKSLWKSFPNLKQLQQSGDFEVALETNVVPASFSTLTLSNIANMISLSPSLVSSQNLTHLQVTSSSNRLTILMTSLTARSLVHLTHLSVCYCHKMEEIITKQEGDNDEDKEIIFRKLNVLKFVGMPRLKRFCGYNYTFRFPLLEKIIMTRCSKFKIFSPGLVETPSLKSIQLSEDGGEHHEIWDTNLNKTFYQQQFVASREVVLDKCNAGMIRDDRFPQVEILGIEGFVDDEWVTLLRRFPKLNELHVNDCSFEEIISSHAPSLTSFYNLTELSVSKCHQLLYLVTNSTAKSLVNLETLQISDCEKMKEIVKKESSEDVEREVMIFNGLRILKLESLPRLKTEDFNIEDRAIDAGFRSLFGHNKVLLPKLEILELSNLLNNSISLIWDGQLLHNSFNNLKMLIVQSCGSLKSLPLHVLKSLNNLENLEVGFCNMLEMVFGSEDVNDYKGMESSSVVAPLNLTQLEVKGCPRLTTLMTSSMAKNLVHLTYLLISNCHQIKEIITKQEGEDEKGKEIVFSKLEFLELLYLPRLKRFCSHDYTFNFSLLEYATIRECPQLTMFCPGAIHAPLLKSIQVTNKFGPHTDSWMNDLNDTIQHRFTIEEVISTTRSMALNSENITMIKDVFPKVENLFVESFMDERVTFPYNSLERFPKLRWLCVEHSSFEEIFPSNDHITDDFMEEIPPFKELRIANLDKLKSIWKDDSHHPPIHQNLTFLEVESCCNLLKLAPSSASFQYLRQLYVFGCHQLIHLVTSSTAKSLVSLERLEINDCKDMEEIVMNETNKDVEGAITFNRLSGIELADMPSLKMFSSQSHTFQFPKLEVLRITGCPEMTMFCLGVLETPKLSKVKIEDHEMGCMDEGDINKTIQMLSSAKESVVNV